jgi:single-stranded-DNA-specific exonuclease
LAREAAVPPLVAQLLLNRGLTTAAAARAYLHPALDQLHDPSLMQGMAAASARIQQALAAAEPILVYGDYDVDGTIATVLLKTALEMLHARVGPKDKPADVRFHIPHRIREGYGMQAAVIADAADAGIRLVISVDTGMRDRAPAAEAAARGIDLIITDHHLPDATHELPHAVAVVNPNQPGCTYPCKSLCGAGIAFKLAQALLEAAASTDEEKHRLRTKTLPSFLKLLSIATIADCVPLTDENRVIVAVGLAELAHPAQPGLRALMGLASLDPTRPLTAVDVAFRLAPRINAAGRMDIAADVVDLFLTRDPAQGRALAEKLHALNEDRRSTEAAALAAIESRLAAMDVLPACFVLDDPTWHRGVLGILASRVVERTGRPTLVLTSEDGQAHGSGRSVSGFHLLDALTHANGPSPGQGIDVADDAGMTPGIKLDTPGLFTRFGGHAHAVGFSLPQQNVAALRERMHRYASGFDLSGQPPLECDAELPLSAITGDLAQWLDRFAPFGIGNAEPLFIARCLRLAEPPRLLKQMHLKLLLEDTASGARFYALAWGRGEGWAQAIERLGLVQHAQVDVAYRLRRNHHPQFGGLELEIAAIQSALPIS